MRQKMIIFGGVNCGHPDWTEKLHYEILSFLQGASLEGILYTDSYQEVVELAYKNRDAAFVFCPGKIPGPIYNFFLKDPTGLEILKETNISLGYLDFSGYSVKELVFCFNWKGKIDVRIKPKSKRNHNRLKKKKAS